MLLTPSAISAQAELEAAFADEEIVVVCWEPGCLLHRLPHWPEEQWVVREPRKGYPRYSHGLCRQHFLKYQQEIERLMAAG